MKTTTLSHISYQTIIVLYVLLWSYAGFSKLLTYDAFQVQLSQSPMLSPWAAGLVISVPLLELFLALALLVPKLQTLALYGSLFTMTAFSCYIYLLLHYSSHVPCSCGGILNDLSWNAHLIFNGLFVLFAMYALYIKTLL